HASQNRRETGEGFGTKAHYGGNVTIRTKLGQKYCGQNTKGDTQARSNPYHHQRAYNGIAETTTFLKGRWGEFDKQLPAECRPTAPQQHDERGEQRDAGEDGHDAGGQAEECADQCAAVTERALQLWRCVGTSPWRTLEWSHLRPPEMLIVARLRI